MKKLKLKFPNVPAILRGWIKAAFLRYCWQHELTGTAYDPEQFAKTMLLKRLELDEKAGIEAIIDCDHNSPSRIILDFFAHLALEGAENYREFQLRWRAMKEGKEDIDAVVIVQRRFGLSPHQAREQAEHKLRIATGAARDMEARLAELHGALDECQHQLEDFRRAEPEDLQTMGGGMRNVRELCAEIRRGDKRAADMAIDLGAERGYAAKLEELIQHWHLYLNYHGAAPEKLTSEQRELFAEVWRKHVEKANGEEAGF